MKKVLFVTAALLFAGILFADGEKNYGGGKPWVNSANKENITGILHPSPKDDFHVYVNYDWLQKNEIPEGKSNYSSFREVENEVQQNIYEVLTDTKTPGLDAENVRSLYNDVLDWNSRNSLGMKPVESVIDEIKSIKTIDELSDFITNPQKTFLIPTFFNLWNITKFSDSSSYISIVDFEGLILGDSAEYKKRTEIGERYYNAALYKAKALLTRLDYSETDAEQMLNTVLKIEAVLAPKIYTNAEMNSPDFIKTLNKNVYTPEKTFKLSSKFPLKRFIENEGYGNAKEFLIVAPKYFSAVDKIYRQENLEDIKTFLIVKTVNNYAWYLDREAYDISKNAENIVSGSSGKLPDQKMAVETVRIMLNTPLNRAYLSRFDLSELKTKITEMCKQIIATYRDMLNEEDWLSEQTRQKALEKLDSIKIHSIYPEKWIDYSGLKLKGLSYLECIRAIDSYNREIVRSRTNGKVDKEIWDTDSLLVANAFYQFTENSINIIPGLIGKPFYYKEMSQEALLGGIGSVIAHEISHAFDTQGAQFDKNGSLTNWWTKEDYNAFKKRASKLISYYNGITIWEGLQCQGELVQTEAIADMAGVKTMLRIAKTIPDFNYKEFFESHAIIWREIITPETDMYFAYNDPHPQSHLRTNVTLQQFDEFIVTYDIKPGDNMYLAPGDRILVW